MKMIRIQTSSKDQMLKGVMLKIKEVLSNYDKENNFDPNYAIKIYNEKDDDRIIIIRISRSPDYKTIGFTYFIHLCVGSLPNTEYESISTTDIIKYNDENDMAIESSILDLLNEVIPYKKGNKISIRILNNEAGVKSTWYSLNEDSEELQTVDTFIDYVAMPLVNHTISDRRPSASIFFEYSLRDGVNTDINSGDPIYFTIQKSDIVENGFMIGGSMPSAMSDTGRDLGTYTACYADIKPLLKQYLGQLFKLKNVLFYDEHLRVVIVLRTLDQCKIVI